MSEGESRWFERRDADIRAKMFDRRVRRLRSFRGYTEDEATLASLAADCVEALRDVIVADTAEEQGAAIDYAIRSLRVFSGGVAE